MNVRRRSAAALAAIAVLGAAAAPAVAADPSPSASAPSGLFGSTDPQYDGVWRQSLALLAQKTEGLVPSSKAVKWLTDQQCDNGAFAPFRADPAMACDAKTMVDTNSTAAAVQALWAVGGHGDVVEDALTWLKSVQNKDGGWGYSPGGPSDANSTSVVIGALTATETDPARVVKDGKSPYDALLTFALPCGKDKGAGAFAFQPDKDGKLLANADATAAGVLGALGKGLVTGAGEKAGAATCADAGKPTRDQAAANGAAYLADALAEDGHLTSALGGSADQPDYGNTADAVVALAAQGGADKAAKPLAWLQKNAAAWAKQSGPAAYAQLIFAAHATGTDPRDFGGQDLVALLGATGPGPQGVEARDSATASAQDEKDKTDGKDEKEDDSPFGVWWFVGICLVFGIGVGFLLSGRNKKQQP
ncbi:prenyltransferase/squalene oxidase repeat-containing protein [Streptomyces lancefieldiae]|uniref:Prenyltransferase/squalene oxidase repeat-containing protein n=1 Tax=Streptomyces lancefieldiae TaxID=3075520 RepID=A0ABU3AP69_9ACTN|nr:prenyltransferase/squalene oxidase repeat-containing protein [Streptomyces sp. DSM 40712]MDT0611967.1 prenyltransferase/squalene oxidase repeat-containing protein [Streptomyces sp. DSM 40712]